MSLKQIFKENFLSRKFIVLVIATTAFWTTAKFDATNLVIVMGIYCGANVLEKLVQHKNGG